jgi:hypothetical protein
MSTQKRQTTAIEKEGVNFVRGVVESANCIFHEIHRENDFGNDAIIELVDKEEVKGICIAAQIKSGDSYCTQSTCSIPADRAHFEYWAGHSLPIIGIVYDPSIKLAFWTSITQYLENHPHATEKGPYTITFSKDELSKFDGDIFTSLFIPIFLQKPVDFSYEKSVEWAQDDDHRKHLFGIISLMNAYREKPESWDVLFEIFHQKPFDKIHPRLIYYLGLSTSHQDIFWHAGNKISNRIQEYVKSKIRQFKRQDVIKLLEFIGEDGVGRGTLGQHVLEITLLIDNRRQIIEEIAFDSTLDFRLRTKAIPVYIGYEAQGVAQFLSKLLVSDEQMKVYVRQYIRSLGLAESAEVG